MKILFKDGPKNILEVTYCTFLPSTPPPLPLPLHPSTPPPLPSLLPLALVLQSAGNSIQH